MTMGLAVVPQDMTGAVVMSDSMGMTIDGRQQPGASKLGFLAKARTAYVVSGFPPEDLAGAGDESDFDSAIAMLYAAALDAFYAICATHPTSVTDGRFPQLLAAGVAPGQPPQIACLAPSLDQWRLEAGPGFHAVGWWVGSWLAPRRELEVPVPETLVDARNFAVDLAMRQMAAVLRPDEVPIGWPMRVVVITADDVAAEEVES